MAAMEEPRTEDMMTISAPLPGESSEGAAAPETLAAITALLREHSRWAVWPPLAPYGRWTAVRVAGSRAPGPGLPLVWASAATATELGARMRRANAALGPGG